MNLNKNLKTALGTAAIILALLAVFFLLQPSAEDILVTSLETLETINDAHAVITLDAVTPEESFSATVEVWGRHGEDDAAFRLEVLDASRPEAIGSVIVSDGETLWLYNPTQEKVFIGTLEEARAYMEAQDFEGGETAMPDMPDMPDMEEMRANAPETAEEAVAMLLEYVTVKKAGSDIIAGQSAYLLQFEPIAEQMPPEFAAVGGYIHLWIDKGRNIPLAVAYLEGSMGSASIRTADVQINSGLEDSIFTFDLPSGVEIVNFSDIVPQSLSLEDAAESAEFTLLTPTETPDGATLVDIVEMQDTFVQRYALPDGSAFSVLQGLTNHPTPDIEAEIVEVRGVPAMLYQSEDGGQVLLTWMENHLFFSIAGDLTAEQAMAIAESLK